MQKINPSDDAIAIAASHISNTLMNLRFEHLESRDFAQHEKYLMSYYKWAVDQLVIERNA